MNPPLRVSSAAARARSGRGAFAGRRPPTDSGGSARVRGVCVWWSGVSLVAVFGAFWSNYLA
jgi:hypothetical protein